MAKHSRQPSGPQATHFPQNNSRGMNNSFDENALRSTSTQRPARRSRPRPDPTDGPDESADRQQPSSRSSIGPQHRDIAPAHSAADSCFFDFVYRFIFSMVHMALSVALSPVLGKDGARTAARPTARSSLLTNATDPELAIPEDCGVSGDGERGGPCSPPILRTDSRRCGEAVSAERKSVWFPPPERSRPPLGRIGLPSSSVCCSSYRSAPSSENDSSSHGDGRQERPARRSNFTSGRRRLSPLPLARLSRNPRMQHSTYFLE